MMSQSNLREISEQDNEQAEQPALSLRPAMDERIRRFLETEQQRVFDLVDMFGSPLNLIFPQKLKQNIESFRKVYKERYLRGQIYFTSKPNKAQSIVRQAALEDVGIDVSSVEALKIALASGFRPERIECTGPKNKAYLSLAVQMGVIINADNMMELQQALTIKRSLNINEKLRVFVRLTGFHSPRIKYTTQDGTFGVHVDDVPQIISFLKEHQEDISFLGFAFHFRAMGPEHKAVAIENTLQATFAAKKAGLPVKGINIGGGFDIQYAADAEEWNRYVETLKQSILENARPLTWNNAGLGFRNEGGQIKGAPNFVQHHMASVGADDFDDYMGQPLPAFNHHTAAQIISDSMLEVYIEPGRALLDQMGLTIGRVNFHKKSVNGETLVGLDMNRSGLHATHQKLLTDPVIFYQDKPRCRPCPEGVYYMGNLCVSYDMITYNKTFPEYLPEPGDLVVFVNTAPYLMDFIESQSLHQPLGEKITVIEDKKFRHFPDRNYNPAAMTTGERV